MESVISKEQLDMLLGTMRDSVPAAKVIKSLKQSYSLNVLEKNAFYHSMLEMIKKSNNSKDAVIAILEAVEDLLEKKANAVIADVEVAKAQEVGDPSKMSPIFRRVG